MLQPPVLSVCQGLTGVVESRCERPEEGQVEGHQSCKTSHGEYLVLTVLWPVLCVAYAGVPLVILAHAKHGFIFAQ